MLKQNYHEKTLSKSKGIEPVAYETYKGILLHAGDPKVSEHSNPAPLFDESAILAARLKGQEEAVEACAEYVHQTKGAIGSVNMAESILSGEWRKYLKEDKG